MARDASEPSEQEDALYDALAAFSKAEHAPEKLGPWQLADARRAMALLGAQYVSSFPQSKRVAQVKFNVARAAYDEGDWVHASELFAAYCDEHPDTADTGAAANLALDALHVAGDYEGLDKTGRALAANTKLPEPLRKQLDDVVNAARKERLSAVALQSGAKTGDAAVGLVELADQKPGTELGEQALHAAFVTYREKKDYAHVAEVGAKFLRRTRSRRALPTCSRPRRASASSSPTTTPRRRPMRRSGSGSPTTRPASRRRRRRPRCGAPG